MSDVTTGEIRTYLDAMGAGEDSAELSAAMAVTGGGFELDDTPYDEPGDHYLVSKAGGVTVLVQRGVVTSIFLEVRGGHGYTPYARVDTLVAGLSADSTREDVRSLLGEPFRSAAGYDLYQVDGRLVHFEFDDGALVTITFMAEDPLA